MPHVYAQLRQRARHHLRKERRDHTLQPTALVNEVLIRMVDRDEAPWRDRKHFFNAAELIMRHVLADYGRYVRAQKRFRAGVRVTLDEGARVEHPRHVEYVLLDRALEELETRSARKARIVKLRYLAGMSEREISGLLGIPRSAVHRELVTACRWLYRRMRLGRRSGSSERVPPDA